METFRSMYWFFLILRLGQVVNCSKILALMTVPAHSHHLWSQVYLKALTARGHEVTYLGVDEYKNPPPNIRYIQIENQYDNYDSMNFTEISRMGRYKAFNHLMSWYDFCTEKSIHSKGLKQFLNIIKTEKFDLVVYDLGTVGFILGAVDVLGRPPIIGVTAWGIPSWAMDFSGTPYPVQNSPHFLLPFGNEMNFWERLQNAIFYHVTGVIREIHMEGQDAVSQQLFGPGVRPIQEIMNDITINMINANWATDSPFPATPGLISISGLHIAQPKPLPQELKRFLDSSPDGVIYFSLGSNVQSTLLHEKEINTLITAFKQLAPLKILWKWEKDELPDKPDNVKTAKWMPQNDILAHPNIRLFFTHGGMLSSQEALYHGVPIVGMPVFLDQHVNVLKAVKLGYGEAQSLEQLNSKQLVETITKVLKNPSYKKKAVELSKIFRDQINSPLDTAVYWTEYAIRHNGAHHLLPPSKKMNWFQASAYDLLAVFLISVVLVLHIIQVTLQFLYRLIFKSKEKIKKH